MATIIRAISLTLLLLAMLFLIIGLFLSEEQLQQLATLLSQSGSLNPTLMAKVQLFPRLCVLSSIEVSLLAMFIFYRRNRMEKIVSDYRTTCSARQILWFGLFALYGLLAFISLNFYAVSLTMRFSSMPMYSSGNTLRGPAEYEAICSAIRAQTPSSARILIQTARDEKYLLNYDLYPRRFYFYPDHSVPVAGIPDDWLRKYQIGWILEIPATDPLTLLLRRCPGNS
jgi:hypothetical protein